MFFHRVGAKTSVGMSFGGSTAKEKESLRKRGHALLPLPLLGSSHWRPHTMAMKRLHGGVVWLEEEGSHGICRGSMRRGGRMNLERKAGLRRSCKKNWNGVLKRDTWDGVGVRAGVALATMCHERRGGLTLPVV